MPKRRHSRNIRYHVRAAILDLLAERHYQQDDKLPTEPEFMDLLDVSRSSLREGLQLLEQEGFIRTRHGSGRYLNIPTTDFQFDISHLQGVTDMMRAYGIQVTTHVLSLKELPADQEVANHLEIEPGASVVWIERIRLAGEISVIYSIDILPKQMLPDDLRKERFEGSLLRVLEEESSIYVDHSRATIRAITSRKDIPKEVIQDPNMPWIMMEQVNYDAAGHPVIFSKDYHRGDTIAFFITRHRY